MIEQNSIGNISIEVTPDILIALSRAIMRFHKLWSRQKELLDIAYWNSLTIKEKANRITAIKNEIDELTRCFGDLDDGETYGILPYGEQMHKIVLTSSLFCTITWRRKKINELHKIFG